MPEKKSEYSLLVNILMIVIFLLLAILGSYIILYMPFNIFGPDDGSAGVDYTSSGGYGSTFFLDGVSRENQSGLQYARNGSFSGIWNYSAINDPPVNGSCLMLALADYKLTPLYYNGSLANSHTLRYRTPVSVNVSFNLTGLQEGFHDVLFLTIKNPYADPLSIQGHVFPQGADGDGMLFTVIEGNDTRPDLRYGQGLLEKYVSYRNISVNNLMGYGPWITDTPFADMISPDNGSPSGEAIYIMDASPGEDVDYYINVKNGVGSTNERFNRFTLLQLLDYEQVPIRTDTPEYVYNGTLDPGKMLAIHAGMKAPEAPGTHVLSLVLSKDPYENNVGGSVRNGYTPVISVVLNVKG